MRTPLPFGTRVSVGNSKRVHIIRHGTVWTRRGYGTTYCGYYGGLFGGWMKVTEDVATCKTCVARHAAGGAA